MPSPRVAGLVLGLVIAGPAAAGMVPGGGNAASDCYAELEVVGVDHDPEAIRRNKTVRCVDGDPCDSGPCGDGVCDFQVRLCWNQDDPKVAACVPPPRLESLLLRGQLRALMILPESLDGSGCSDEYIDFPVATRGIRRPGRANVRFSAKAPDGTTPPADADWIRLVCVPRSFESCPMPTPTTTLVPGTTLPGQSTTTSTTVTPTTTTSRKTTTTRRRRTTTTTTVPLPTTTLVIPTTSTAVVPTTTFTILPTTLPTSTLPSTTLAVATTTPTTTNTTTTTRKRKRGEKDDLIGLDLPLI